MAVSAAEIAIAIRARDEATKALTAVKASLAALGTQAQTTTRAVAASGQQMAATAKQVESSGLSFGKLAGGVALGTVAANAFMGAASAVGGVLAGGIRAAAGFSQSMADVNAALPAGQFEQFGGQLNELALRLGKDFPISAADAGRAIQLLAQRGISASDILGGAGEAVAKFNAATGADLVTAAGIAAAAINAFGLSGSEAINVVNLMTGAVLRGGTSAEAFGQAMQQTSAMAKLVGLDIESTTIAIAAMARMGIQGSDAGTSLKMMLINLQPSTKTAAAAMQQLGIITATGANQFYDAAGRVKSFEEISRVLAEATRGLTEEQRQAALVTIFGTDAIRAATAAARLGAGDFGDLADAIRATDADEAARKRMDTLKGALEQLSGSLETLEIALLGKLEPAFKAVVLGANDFVGVLIGLANQINLSDFTKNITEGIGRIKDAFVNGGVDAGLRQMLSEIDSFGRSMFGAGYNLIATFAEGMWSAISLVADVVSSVVGGIASMMVGQSPPPEGPLSEIDAAGARLIETYVGGMASADLAPLTEVTERIGASFEAAFRPDVLANAQQAFRDSAGNLEAMKDAAADVEGALKAIEQASREVDKALQDNRDKIADVRDRYDEQLDALHAQLDAINDVNNALKTQQDIQERIADLELDKQINAAKGDPVKRAEIKSQQEDLRFQKEEIQQRIRALELDGGRKQNAKEIERLKTQLLDLDKKELELKKQESDLTDRVTLAELTRQKDINKAREDEKRIVDEQAKLQRELASLPIKQQIKDLEQARKDELKPLEAQSKELEKQKRLIADQRQAFQDLKRDIQEAVNALPKKAGGGAGGGGFGGFGARTKEFKDPNKGVEGQKENPGDKIAREMMLAVDKWIREHAGQLIGGALGAAVGGIAFGPIGALVGGLLGSEIAKKLEEKFPGLGTQLQASLLRVVEWWNTDGAAMFGAIPKWFEDTLKPVVTWWQNKGWPEFKYAFWKVGQWWASEGSQQFMAIVTYFDTTLKTAVNWWLTDGWPKLQEAIKKVTDWWNSEGSRTFGLMAAMLEGAFKTSMLWWHEHGWPDFEKGIRAVATAWQDAGLPKFQDMIKVLGVLKDGVLLAYVGTDGLWAKFKTGVENTRDALELANTSLEALRSVIEKINLPNVLPALIQTMVDADPRIKPLYLLLVGIQGALEWIANNAAKVAGFIGKTLADSFFDLLGPLGKVASFIKAVIDGLAAIQRERRLIESDTRIPEPRPAPSGNGGGTTDTTDDANGAQTFGNLLGPGREAAGQVRDFTDATRDLFSTLPIGLETVDQAFDRIAERTRALEALGQTPLPAPLNTSELQDAVQQMQQAGQDINDMLKDTRDATTQVGEWADPFTDLGKTIVDAIPAPSDVKLPELNDAVKRLTETGLEPLSTTASDVGTQLAPLTSSNGGLPDLTRAMTDAAPIARQYGELLQHLGALLDELRTRALAVAGTLEGALVDAFMALVKAAGKLAERLDDVIDRLRQVQDEREAASAALKPSSAAAATTALLARQPTTTAASAKAGATTIIVNVHGSVTTERDLAAKVRDEILRVGRRNGSALGSLA